MKNKYCFNCGPQCHSARLSQCAAQCVAELYTSFWFNFFWKINIVSIVVNIVTVRGSMCSRVIHHFGLTFLKNKYCFNCGPQCCEMSCYTDRARDLGHVTLHPEGYHGDCLICRLIYCDHPFATSTWIKLIDKTTFMKSVFVLPFIGFVDYACLYQW